MHAPPGACIRSLKNKNRPSIRAVVILRRLALGTVFRASSGSAAQGTVASPGPVAGSDVAIGPLLMLVNLLAVAIDRRQPYNGTAPGIPEVLFTFTENLITLPVSEEEAK